MLRPESGWGSHLFSNRARSSMRLSSGLDRPASLRLSTASEGLSVLVLDTRSFGGQAGASARIENYLGFPTGISGQALTARAFIQAQSSAPNSRSRFLSQTSIAQILRCTG